MNMVRIPGGTSGNQYQAPQMRLGRSQFDLSRNHKTTFNAGYLVPYFLTQVYPGDTHTLKLNAFLRIFSPLDAPIMDNIHVDIDYFYVPSRILWTNWEAFLGEHATAGAQDVDFTLPVLSGGSTISADDTPGTASALARYMGIPVGLETAEHDVQALPFRAYQRIYNEWYRDQNLIDKKNLPTPIDDGPDAITEYAVYKSAKKHDYFTSALPYLQKGDPISIPLDGLATVIPDSTNPEPTFQGTAAGTGGSLFTPGSGTEPEVHIGGTSWTTNEGLEWNNPRLFADLSTLSSTFTINALREAAAMQRMLEKDARGGTRHPELIREHFGVDVPDYRTGRPEYLGGGSGYINVSPVANTSSTATEVQGQLTGIGTGTLGGSFAKSFVEHGWIFGILRARGEISYSQGLERFWFDSVKHDLLWPELAQLGEQPIYNREIFISNDSNDDDVFGYQERYAHLRYGKSLVTGLFDPAATGSLDFWHLSEDFGSLPGLNATFIQDQTPMTRVKTYTTAPDFIIDGRFQHRVARALPVRPTPTLGPARF